MRLLGCDDLIPTHAFILSFVRRRFSSPTGINRLDVKAVWYFAEHFTTEEASADSQPIDPLYRVFAASRLPKSRATYSPVTPHQNKFNTQNKRLTTHFAHFSVDFPTRRAIVGVEVGKSEK
jgi:hypothetical protein